MCLSGLSCRHHSSRYAVCRLGVRGCRCELLRLVGLVLLLVGCGGDDPKRRAAYDEAMASVAREKSALRNIMAEQQRVYGEYKFLVFVSRLQSGEFSPSGVLGLPWADEAYRRNPPVITYLHDKLPLGWFGQLDRLLIQKSTWLPWFNRTSGDLYRRRIDAQFSRMLFDLRERVSLQTDRVRNAEEYARLIEPEATAQ